MARKKQIFSLFVALSCVLLGTTSCQSKHTHDYHVTNKIEATCEEQGKITYTCDCGDYYETIIDKKDMYYQKTISLMMNNTGYIARFVKNHQKKKITT